MISGAETFGAASINSAVQQEEAEMSAEPRTETEAVIDKRPANPVEIVSWWDAHVRKRHLTVAEAEEQTGVTKKQVVTWRRRLKEPA